MKKLALLLLFAPALVSAAGPRFKQTDPNVQQEFENVYQDLRTVSGTTSTSLDPISVSTLTVTSSGTITNLKVTNLTGVTLGKVKQVKQCTSSTAFTTTSSTWAATNLSCTITPTVATSSISVQVNGVMTITGTGNNTASIFRGTFNLGDSADGMTVLLGPASGTSRVPGSMGWIDFPSTTSATTYAIKIFSSDGVSTVGFGRSATPQVMTLWEIGQ